MHNILNSCYQSNKCVSIHTYYRLNKGTDGLTYGRMDGNKDNPTLNVL